MDVDIVGRARVGERGGNPVARAEDPRGSEDEGLRGDDGQAAPRADGGVVSFTAGGRRVDHGRPGEEAAPHGRNAGGPVGLLQGHDVALQQQFLDEGALPGALAGVGRDEPAGVPMKSRLFSSLPTASSNTPLSAIGACTPALHATRTSKDAWMLWYVLIEPKWLRSTGL